MSSWWMVDEGLPADPQETSLVAGASVGKDTCTDIEQTPVLLYQFKRMPRKSCTPPGCKLQYVSVFSHFSCFLTQGVCSTKLTSVFLCQEGQLRKGSVGKPSTKWWSLGGWNSTVSIGPLIFQSTSIFTSLRTVSFNPCKAGWETCDCVSDPGFEFWSALWIWGTVGYPSPLPGPPGDGSVAVSCHAFWSA